MAEININPFFDEMKVKGDRLHCRQHNPSDFAPVGLNCTCDKGTKMPDDGGEIERALFSNNTKQQRLRMEKGLPKHYKCDCSDCETWRSKNWSRIESLDWTDAPLNSIEVHISPMPAGLAVTKPQYNTVLTDLGQAVEAIDKAATAFGVKGTITKSLQRALEAGSYTYNTPPTVDPGPSQEDIESGVYLQALAIGGPSDWPTIKLRMKQIKDRIKAERKVRKPRRTSTPSTGKKTSR
jgi:hypothetical protein